jgi:hypothetical protein
VTGNIPRASAGGIIVISTIAWLDPGIRVAEVGSLIQSPGNPLSENSTISSSVEGLVMAGWDGSSWWDLRLISEMEIYINLFHAIYFWKRWFNYNG